MPSTINVGKPALTRGRWTRDEYNVTAAQTFKVGDWVYLDSNGTLVIAAAASNDVGNVLLLGIASGNAVDYLALGTKCPVDIPGPDAECLFALYHGTAASAVLAETTLDAPTSLPLRNQGGQWVLNVENDGTNDRVVVTAFHPEYPAGTQYGWVWGRVLLAKQVWQSAT